MTSDDKLVEAVNAAIQHAQENPIMVPCPRCEGKGYHHGFGEDGFDPDWCERCGGSQVEQDPAQIPRTAILATLQGIREPTRDMLAIDAPVKFDDTRAAEPFVWAFRRAIWRNMLTVRIASLHPKGEAE